MRVGNAAGANAQAVRTVEERERRVLIEAITLARAGGVQVYMQWRVQEAGVGGGGGNAVVSVGASAATRTGTGGSAGATSGANTGGTSGNPTNQ